VFVDHGLLRCNEGEQVMNTFAEHLGVRVIRVDARLSAFSPRSPA
jgi:GMP synthase (glutamine-hydrolysing)